MPATTLRDIRHPQPRTAMQHPFILATDDCQSTASSRCPSPYPASASDSDTDDTQDYLAHASVQKTIATLPETQLREIVSKLASSNPLFQRAIARALTPEARPRVRRRKSHHSLESKKAVVDRVALCGRCGHIYDSLPDHTEHTAQLCAFHPGQCHRLIIAPMMRL